ncbi:Fc.00g082780.m01.CDS01 [Cosmosporella sp. VM-42]
MSGWSILRRFSLAKSRKTSSGEIESNSSANIETAVPETQTVLLLRGPRQEYQLVDDYAVPRLAGQDEILVKNLVIGLNPIDWKAPDFNFGISELPYISGRELAGEVVQVSQKGSRLKVGDNVIAISTDYRDLRKGTFQQYVAALSYNVVRLPKMTSVEDGATLGVAFVAAALALGVCLGVDFSKVLDGPDLFKLVRKLKSESLPDDVRKECLNSIGSHERARAGDWLAIWGGKLSSNKGSATSANLIIQLARLADLKVIAVVDKAKHGLRFSNHAVIRPDLLVDSHDPARAVDIFKANTCGKLRFGIDTRGKDSAAKLLEALSPDMPSTAVVPGSGTALPSPPGTPQDSLTLRAHIVGLTGLPKDPIPDLHFLHTVPIKLFHEVPQIGESLVFWLERLLEKGLVSAPEIMGIEDGFESVNQGLNRMRRGEISGGKLIVRV